LFLLYLDDSGSVTDPASRVFILAGLSLFERQTHWLERQIEAIAARFDAGNPRAVELHGSPMLNGRGFWRRIPLADRHQAMVDALACVRDAHTSVSLFGVGVDRSLYSGDPIADSFECLASSFDRALVHMHVRRNSQRGLIVFDKHKSEEAIQSLARDFKELGHRWGLLRNMAEVPVFLDSRASRLIQVADLIAFSMKRRYQNGDSRFFDIIRERFYREGPQTVGLIHLPAESPLFAQTAARHRIERRRGTATDRKPPVKRRDSIMQRRRALPC
jgi:hypothetical protein